MGLDQYAYVIKRDYNDENSTETTVKTEFFTWRKHNALEGYMAELYAAKTGDHSEFNCKKLTLVESDLNELEKAVKEDKLPTTKGFFFGADTQLDQVQKEKDLKFIKEARAYLEEGYTLGYTSWW